LGYYRRARSLLAGAKAIRAEHGGCFPRSFEAALRVPGVGRYTAAAVLSIAYDLPHAVVDGNVERVVSRPLRIEGDPKRGEAARAIRRAVDRWIPDSSPGDFNQALMELGATICTPSSPACDRCVLAAHCAARREGDVDRFPQSAPRRAPIDVRLEAGLLWRDGKWLISRPSTLPFLRGLWVFPLIEIPG